MIKHVPNDFAICLRSREQVYEPDSMFSILPEALPWLGTMGIMLALSFLVFEGLCVKANRIKKPHHNPFNPIERTLIRQFYEQPEMMEWKVIEQ